MTNSELANAHAKNRQKLKKAITQVNRSLNVAIKDNIKELEDANIRLIIILYSAYLEASLNFILNFYVDQLGERIKKKVLCESSEIEKWLCLINELFIYRYLKGKRRALNLINLGHTNYHRYLYIKDLADVEIRSIIEIRNKLAHGQWAVAFTNEGERKNQEITTRLWTLNKKDVLLVKNTIKNFISLIDVLAASEGSFKDTFDDVVSKLEITKQQHEELYGWLISELKRKKPKLQVDRSV